MAKTLHPDEELATTADDSLTGSGSARSLLRDPAAAVERVVQGAHEAIDRVAAHAVPAAEQLAQRASSANTVLHDKADRLGEIQEQWLNDARDTVRDHPLTSVLAAAAIGMIIARLTSR